MADAAGMNEGGEPLFTREDAIQEFARKFPVDEPAANRLRNLADDQLQRVFNEFSPAQDSNPDYSRRLMGFLKTVTYNTGPPPPGSTAALLAGGAVGQYSGPIVSMEQLEMFRLNFPMDERAFDYLKVAPPDIQERVVSTFRANCVQDDYSKMVTGHVRFCMSKRDVPGVPTGLGGGFGGGGGGGGYQQQPNPNQSSVSVEAAFQAITGTIPMGAAVMGAEVPQEQLDLFAQQYPMDERASEYLRSAPVEVQHRVISTFKVNGGAGQVDFSRAVTGHVRFCLNQHRSQTSAPMEVPAGTTAEQTLQMIADFQGRYPMDERALQYLLNTSAEAKQRVLTEFRPTGTVDGDYSKAVTAFVRRCRDEEKSRAFVGAGGFASSGGGCGGFRSMGGNYGAAGGQGCGSAGSSVEQTARQLVEMLGQVGGQGNGGVQQAQHLIQQALQVAADGVSSKRPRLESPAAMMQGGGMLRPGGGMAGGRPGFSGPGGGRQWGGTTGF